MIKGTPRSRHNEAISSTGCTKPKTLDTWQQITASVSGVTALSKASSTASG